MSPFDNANAIVTKTPAVVSRVDRLTGSTNRLEEVLKALESRLSPYTESSLRAGQIAEKEKAEASCEFDARLRAIDEGVTRAICLVEEMLSHLEI